MANWLQKLLGWTSAEDRAGAELTVPLFWEITAPKDGAEFVRALPEIVPEDGVIYLEDGSPDEQIREFMRERSIEPHLKIALGTIWPRPKVFHVPATHENITDLAAVFECHVALEVCIHLHAYHNQAVILQWHDAFFDDPILISPSVPEIAVKRFCERCGCSYKLLT